jgi:hypothetical protein
MVSAFLTSLLARQFLMLEEQGFLQRHPHAWLMWEPGNWTAPSAPKGGTLETRLPTPIPRETRTPPKGEALCFELNPKKPLLTLGRGEDNDICIMDATVSRQHLRLEFKDQRWHAQPLAGHGGVSVSGVPLELERWHRLERQQKLKLGGVELTFLDASDLSARVNAEAAAMRGK